MHSFANNYEFKDLKELAKTNDFQSVFSSV